MITLSSGLGYVEAELGDIVYITYGSMGEDGHVHGTTERLGHFLEGQPYPQTDAELMTTLQALW